jgi:DNA invertase Pin-like site-specific DNA recombinase
MRHLRSRATKLIGYARVSTLDQNTIRQLDGEQLDRVFTDQASGKDLNRPQLEALIDFARDGDTVLVHSMDRLARNLDDLRAIVRRLTDKKLQVRLVKEDLTFTGEDTAMATFLLSVKGAFAEFERALIESDNAKASRWPRRPAFRKDEARR